MVKKLLIKIYEYLWREQPFVKAYILENHCSVSRYGDGELKLSTGESIRFQEYDADFSRKLKSILKGNSNSLVCIFNIFDDFHWISKKPYEYTRQIMIKNRKEWTDCLNLDYKYDNCKIVLIEENKNRLGFKNDFFNNAKSIERILCPAKNAFDLYEKILKVAKNQSKDKLFLIALGPTATLLVNDLTRLSYWAIDIEYEWFKMGATKQIITEIL